MCLQKLINKFWKFIEKNDNIRIANTKYPDDIESIIDIPYIDDGDRCHLLDVYMPKDKTNDNLPTIIDIHGGGYYYGYKEINKLYNNTLAQYGFKVISFNYRLAPKFTFKDMVQDLFEALKWVKDNAEEYKFDLNNLFITGDSAGGTLTNLVLATTCSPKLQEIFEVTPLVSFKAAGITCGVLKPGKNPAFYMKYLYGKEYKKSAFYRVCDFKDNISKDFPPVFFNTCKGDPFKKDNIMAYNLMRDNGLTAELYYYENKKENGKGVGHVYVILTPDLEISSKTNEELINFFRTYID